MPKTDCLFEAEGNLLRSPVGADPAGNAAAVVSASLINSKLAHGTRTIESALKVPLLIAGVAIYDSLPAPL